MFERFKTKRLIHKEIESGYEVLEQYSPEDSRYTVALQNVERLVNLEKNQAITISGDAMLKFGGNLLVCTLLMFHEEIGHVIPAKFMRFFDN